MGFELRCSATMRGMFRVSKIVFAEGCLPCVVPSRAAAPSSHQHSWSRPKSVHGKEPFRIRCGNEPRWFCFCTNNRWCPTLRPRNGYSCICGRCNGGAAGGPRGTFPWKTSQDGAVRRLFPHLDHALVKGLACELVAETQQPLSRQSLADITARACKVLGKPISRSTVWRMLDTDVIKPWRYKYWIVPRDPTLPRRPGRCWISMQVCGRARLWAPRTTSAVPTRRPASKPVAVATLPCPLR
jgi:hypothetical protein